MSPLLLQSSETFCSLIPICLLCLNLDAENGNGFFVDAKWHLKVSLECTWIQCIVFWYLNEMPFTEKGLWLGLVQSQLSHWMAGFQRFGCLMTRTSLWRCDCMYVTNQVVVQSKQLFYLWTTWHYNDNDVLRHPVTLRYDVIFFIFNC